jgi:demethylmenaquinone methyltransferase/2-methoxy-6-polyprenyl-1,4-benzoquinol methylase
MADPVHDALIPADENRRMFDLIAKRYDLMNALMSFGLHRFWRQQAVKTLCATGCASNPRQFLDIGCGTGDITLTILRQDPAAQVTGIDLSSPMLEIAKQKTGVAQQLDRATYQTGNATNLPFENHSFSGIVSAFCLRNIDDRSKAFLEMRRLIKPGGRLVILELNKPDRSIPRLIHQLYTRWIIPALGSLLSQGSAYRYLANSIEHFPGPAAIVSEMTRAGFTQASQVPLTGGFVTLFTATLPGPYTFAAPAYANSLPLAQFIPQIHPGAKVVLNTPAQLLEPLLNGSLDAALLPVAALIANPTLIELAETGICASEKVRSVLLKCRKPLDQVNTLYLDPASRTSNALALILLKYYWKRSVQVVETTDAADARVVIGDQALCEAPAAGGDYDLATAWNHMTGLPFVFAIWVTRRNHPDPQGLSKVIQAAKLAGRAVMPEIARQQAIKLGLGEASCLEYFTECIHYDIGTREREAMQLFQQMLARKD